MKTDMTIGDLFSADGPVSSRPGFEHRPQQESMARAVWEALQAREHLLIEAPTGVGKSLAYLVPALRYALDADRKAIVSTHTRTLQDQLFFKDLPLALAFLGRRAGAVILKGRRNYLCTTRLRHALDSPESMFEDGVRKELEAIREWSRSHSDGDLGALPFLPSPAARDLVASEPGICRPDTCGPGCPYQRIRERARDAQLVIMNHALFFSLLPAVAQEDRLLYENDFVVFDEAHMLESVATESLGARVSRHQLLGAVRRLYNARTKRGVLVAAGARGFRKLCKETERAIDGFFDTVLSDIASRAASTGPAARQVRVKEAHAVPDVLTPSLKAFVGGVGKYMKEADADQKREVEVTFRTLEESILLMEEFLEHPVRERTYWVESNERHRDSVTLCAAPIEVGPLLAERLFRPGIPLILTSATLSLGGDTSYVRRRLGMTTAETLTLTSPFDLFRQMHVRIAATLPAPDDPRYSGALCGAILEAIELTRGRALVLFTSSAVMRSSAQALSGDMEKRGIPLLVQGEEMEKHALLEEFRRTTASVLFGLDSFWMGVDIPGESLSHVIITKLPFSVPNNPMVEARTELITARGGNPFADYALPEAILKFRQGVGRLIRTSGDRGIVTILDSRIVRKSYGRLFLGALPRCPVEIIGSNGEVQEEVTDPW